MEKRHIVWLPIALVLMGAEGVEEEAAGLAPEHPGYGLYQELCAECHGLRADGKGPRAPALRPPPSDLTHLRGPAGGALRVEDLVRVIDGRRTLRAHGDGQMPVWGWELLADLPDPETRERARLQMVYTLAEYVVAIQQPAPAEAEAAEPESTD